jgi:protein TonB
MCAEPIYPVAALRIGAEGVTRLAYTVTESGEITDAVVQVSSGETREHKLLDRSAMAFLRTCRYKGNAVPTPGRFSFEYRWSIS